jgi:hypothetical protein
LERVDGEEINRTDFIFIPRSSHVINFQILHKTYDDETI